MEHPLESKYGLTAYEMLDALDRRFRAKVTLEGAVAEVHMEKKIASIVGRPIVRYERHDEDGRPDFSLWLPGKSNPVRGECKNIRNGNEGYRVKGEIVAYKAETQKTRASKGDPSSRYYSFDQFDFLGVCLGKKTGHWSDFLFAAVRDLKPHAGHPGKLAVMQRVPLPDAKDLGVWYNDLEQLIAERF
jgi:hypothetical protein